MDYLESGGKWYAYSGITSGGPTLPTTVELIKIPSTGLQDSYAKIQPFYGTPVTVATGDALGIKILLDNVAVYESQAPLTALNTGGAALPFEVELFIPRQTELQILSLNTNNNTLQNRGVTVLGWWL